MRRRQGEYCQYNRIRVPPRYNRIRSPPKGDKERPSIRGDRERTPLRDSGHRKPFIEIRTIARGLFKGSMSASSRKAYTQKARYKELFMADRA